MKKTIALLFFVLCAPLFLFANQGLMTGTKNLRVSKTEFFDIIYSEENAVTAKILYDNADDLLREITGEYGGELFGSSFPVVITQGVEQFNAYFTFFPYNHIVVYDTAMISDLAVFSETVLSVFTHELTHAVTYNLKSPFFAAASIMFGDPMAGHYLTVTSGMAEGATVAYESSKGEGRLNDPYALQMVRQAKIEDKFPAYSDVKGASDSYPRNSFYYFNGGFAEYLQRTFGMHKYAEFWYRCVNLKNITAGGAFKKTFGIKLDKAWKMFRDSYVVPDVKAADPVAAGQADDFFVPKATKASLKNNAGSLYSELCVSEKGIYYIDESNSSVYFVDSVQIKKGGTVWPEKLFHHDYIDYLRVSGDGRFAAIGYYSTLASNIKHKVKIYDLQNKTWFDVNETSVVSPSIAEYEGQYFLIYQKYEPQNYSICVQRIKYDKHISGLELFATIPLGGEKTPVDFTDLGNGTFAFIQKAALDYSICVAKLDCSSVTEYGMPLEGMRLRNLSADFSSAADFSYSKKLAFSWATKETLPRLGFLELDNGTFTLSQENISGGVYNPVIMEKNWYKSQGSEQRQILYIGQFFHQNRIFRLNENTQSFNELAVELVKPSEKMNGSDSIIAGDVLVLKSAELPYELFSPFGYVRRGLLIPYPSTTSRNFINYGNSSSYDMSYGVTYFTASPWTSGISFISGGYGSRTKSGAISFEYQNGTGSSLLGYDVKSNVEFDKFGFKQVYGAAAVSSNFDFATRSAFLFTLSADVDYGRVSFTDSNKKIINDNKSVYFRTSQSFTTTYSNVVSSGPGTYERFGINLSAGVIHSYLTKIKPETQKIVGNYDVGLGAGGYIPKLIPLTCFDDFTYNFPVKFNAVLFPLTESEYSAAEFRAETIIFGYNIQKAMAGISALFINDIIVTLRYTGGYDFADTAEAGENWHIAHLEKYINQAASRELRYRDYFTAKISVGFTPNIGTFATSQFRNNFFFSLSFGKQQNLPDQVLAFGLEAQF